MNPVFSKKTVDVQKENSRASRPLPNALLRPLGELVSIGAVALGSTPLAIGRSDKNRLVIPFSTISFRHALIYFEKGSFYVVDEKSTNRTFINGSAIEPKKPARLRNGDHIAFDRFGFLLMMDFPAIAAEHTEEKNGKVLRPIMCAAHPAWKSDGRCQVCGLAVCRFCMSSTGEREICALCARIRPNNQE
jgi:hypothetical protein